MSLRSLLRSGAWVACLLAGASSAQNWKRVTGVDSTRGVFALAEQGGAFYAVSDTLVYKSLNGLSWVPTSAQPPAVYGGYSLYGHSTGLYVGTVQDGVSRTTDGGQTWHRPAAGLEHSAVLGIAALGDTLYAATGDAGVYGFRSDTSGAWFACNAGLFQSGSTALIATTHRLIAGVGAYLFVRARDAAQWTQADLGLSQIQVYDLLATGKFVFAGTDRGVYRSAEDGLAWQSTDIVAMKGKDVIALAAQGSRVFAGINYSGQHWIWSTDDGGATWDVRAHEFTDLWDLRVSGNRMWAARQDGLWVYDLDPVSIRRGSTGAFEKDGARFFEGPSPRRLDGRRMRQP